MPIEAMTDTTASPTIAGATHGLPARNSPLGRLIPSWAPFSIAKRVVLASITLISIVFLTYVGLDMAQGHELGPALQSALEKTPQYLQNLLSGDLGKTGEYGFTRNPIPISEVLPLLVARSLGLLAVSLIAATVLGVGLGLLSARSRKSRLAIPILVGSTVGIATPSFLLAVLLQLAVINLTRLAGKTVLPVGGFGWDAHIILPAIVLAARPLAQITRITHDRVREISGRDYIRTAHSLGIWPHRIRSSHVGRNAAIAILTTIGLSLRFSLASLPVVEYFFGWHGIGYYLLKSITSQELEFAIAMLLTLGIFIILFNALFDFSVGRIDPRSRDAERQKEHEHRSLIRGLLAVPRAIASLVRDNPIRRRLKPEPIDVHIKGFPEPNESSGHKEIGGVKTVQRPSKRKRLGQVLANGPLIFGGLLVAGILFVSLFGAQLAPHSPYTTETLTYENGEFTVPPFEPDKTYPLGTDILGRDILSLILAGAQQTLVLVFLVVLARIMVGWLLGAIAGWWPGSLIDRIVGTFVDIIATFPSLLLAMVLILAFNIRNGMSPFILALCFIGWGEIMQFVRNEVRRIRTSLYIESAVAAGASTWRIVVKHVQPNLIPKLVSIAALEVAAVLLILGELGFVGIFIGGGSFRELAWLAPLFHYSDVPEWGALLSNVRTYAQGYPWMGVYPGLAFFIAILGFSLFGEGIKRLIDRFGVRITRYFNRYTVGLALAGIAGIFYFKGSTGSLAIFERQANTFDGERAMANVEALTLPTTEGRALDTLGLAVAGQWIADRFESMDLQPAGKEFTYFQPRTRAYEKLIARPSLVLDDGGPPLVFGQDFNVYPSFSSISGLAYAPVRFLALGEISSVIRFGYRYLELEDYSFENEILLVFEEDMQFVDRIEKAGTLVIPSSPEELEQRHALSPYTTWGTQAPAVWVDQSTVARLLAGLGFTAEELRAKHTELGEQEIFEVPLNVHAAIDVQGVAEMTTPTLHILGHLPGKDSNEFGGIDNQLFLVLAKYDCPPSGFDAEIFQCANDNASGVAVMLEAIRAMQDSGYQPYRTFLFIAYSGEGFEGGAAFTTEETRKFLESKYGFDRHYDLEGVIELRGLGSGSSTDLVINSGGSRRLAEVFERAAGRMGLDVHFEGEAIDLTRIFTPGSALESGSEAPRIEVYREGWELTSHSAKDTLNDLAEEDFEQVGRAVSLMLMIVGRELDY